MRGRKPITKEKAIEKLESLCSRSEQCEYELRKKLNNWGIRQGDIKEIIDHLIEQRYLDDGRYARSFAHDKARFSSWGPFKIRIELARRRINPLLISEALQNIDQSVWKEALKKVSETKSRSLDLVSEEEGYVGRQKLFRYLISRGFPSSASSKAVMLMKRRQEDEMG